MGTIIRRTITVTITETLTITWTTGDDPVPEQRTIELHPSRKEEESHEMLRTPVNDADPDASAASELPEPPLMPADSQRKRARRRRTNGNSRDQ
jgi:hypothetical protein